MRKFHWQ